MLLSHSIYREENMSTKDNHTSLAFGVTGLLLQVTGYVLLHDDKFVLVGLGIILLGAALLCIGFGFYAKAKGHNPAWGIVGMFGLIGLIILALLPDNHPERQRQFQSRRRRRSAANIDQYDQALADLERE